MKLSDLSPHPKNPRKITEAKLEMLGKSIDEFGDISQICYNVRTERLFGGHQRQKKLPPDAEIIIMQKYDPPTRTGTVWEGHIVVAGEKFHVRGVDWDESKERAAMIAANKQGGEWDYSLLSEEILALDHENFDLDLTGFDDKELEKLLVDMSEPKHVEFDAAAEQKQFIVTAFCTNELEMQQLYEELKQRGLECKLIT